MRILSIAILFLAFAFPAAAQTLTIMPNSIEFRMTAGGTAPGSQRLTVSGGYWGTYDTSHYFDAGQTCYAPPSSYTNSESGRCAPGSSIDLTPVNTDGLAVGTYPSDLIIRSPGLPDTTVPVTLVVSAIPDTTADPTGTATVRWMQPAASAPVDVFRLWQGLTSATTNGTLIFEGKPTPDAAGVYSATVTLPLSGAWVWATAANAAGESPASNNLFATSQPVLVVPLSPVLVP